MATVKHLQSYVMFVSKARANLSEATFRCFTIGVGSWHYSQALD
jgi:hypothetical protein